MIARPLKLPVICHQSQADCFFFCSRRSLELLVQLKRTCMASYKAQRIALILSTSATSASLCNRSLCFSVAHYFSKAHFFRAATRTVNYIAVWSHLQIKCTCERKSYSDWRMPRAYCGAVWKWKRLHIETVVERNETLTFYWLLLYVLHTYVYVYGGILAIDPYLKKLQITPK